MDLTGTLTLIGGVKHHSCWPKIPFGFPGISESQYGIFRIEKNNPVNDFREFSKMGQRRHFYKTKYPLRIFENFRKFPKIPEDDLLYPPPIPTLVYS